MGGSTSARKLLHGGGGGAEERVADGADAGTLRPGMEESAAWKGKERRPQGQTNAARALRGRIHVGGPRLRANCCALFASSFFIKASLYLKKKKKKRRSRTTRPTRRTTITLLSLSFFFLSFRRR